MIPSTYYKQWDKLQFVSVNTPKSPEHPGDITTWISCCHVCHPSLIGIPSPGEFKYPDLVTSWGPVTPYPFTAAIFPPLTSLHHCRLLNQMRFSMLFVRYMKIADENLNGRTKWLRDNTTSCSFDKQWCFLIWWWMKVLPEFQCSQGWDVLQLCCWVICA